MLPPPNILIILSKKLIGQRIEMSFSNNQTFKLWSAFMPKRREITNAVDTNLYSLQVYPEGFFQNFDPAAEFDKWAAVEVADYNNVPQGMETFNLPGGLYAVFHYKGSSDNAPQVFSHILQEWLPQSGYKLDARPYFEVLGEKYKTGDVNSEEEIWIPIVQPAMY